MIKILQTDKETTIQQIIWLLNRLSTIEGRFESEESITNSITDYRKHPTQEIYFFNYSLVLENMGIKGKEICALLEGTIKETIIQFVEVEDLIEAGYIVPAI